MKCACREIDCSRWSYTDLDEKCLQKFEVRDFVPANGAHRLPRLVNSGFCAEFDNRVAGAVLQFTNVQAAKLSFV